VPILFKATPPPKVFERMKREHEEFLKSVEKTLHKEAKGMEKYVIKRMNLGLDILKGEITKAKTVTISNATTELVKRLADSFAPDAHVRVLLFPGEKQPKGIEHRNMQFKSADIKIVCIDGNKELPSMSVILDEARTFTLIPDTSGRKFCVEEMVYDDCSRCFNDWWSLGWGAAEK
jgi:sugar-specific transcriptional regulator TrmB